MALGAWMGATPILAAFFVAYRFSQLLRRLFGESSLLASFSPHFEYLRTHQPEKASPFFRDLLVSLSASLSVVIGVLELALFIWWKWGGVSSEVGEILLLTMIMLPGVLFVCLYALFSALLESDKNYFLPSVAPLFFNVVFLATLWWVNGWEPYRAVMMLAAGVTLAFFVQWMGVALSKVAFLKGLDWRGIKLWSPELKQMVGAIGLTMLGVGAVQVNSFVDTLFARAVDLSGPAYLYYAIRIYQLPLALFGVALASALLPPLARARQAEDQKQFFALLQFAFRKSLSLMIPITMGVLIFGESIVNFVYGRGAFDEKALLETTYCLWGYVIGLIPAVMILILAPAFYARKDFKMPLKAALVSVGVNLLLNLLFVYGYQLPSAAIALATSVAAMVNAAYLYRALGKEEESLMESQTAQVMKKVGLCAVLAAIITVGIGYFLMGGTVVALFLGEPLLPRDFLSQVLHLGLYGTLFTAFFFSSAWLLKVDDVFQLLFKGSREIK